LVSQEVIYDFHGLVERPPVRETPIVRKMGTFCDEIKKEKVVVELRSPQIQGSHI